MLKAFSDEEGLQEFVDAAVIGLKSVGVAAIGLKSTNGRANASSASCQSENFWRWPDAASNGRNPCDHATNQ